jgi:hypothetical protein
MGFPITSVVFMLLMAVGMFYGQAQYKKKRAEWGKLLTIICGIGIIITALYTNLCRSPIDVAAIERERKYQEAQAIILANNLANKYNGTGNCLVIHHPTTESGMDNVTRLVEAFRKGFGNKLVDIRAVPIKELSTGEDEDEMMMEEAMLEMTADDFNKIIKANRDCDVIICMVSLPFSEDELYKLDSFSLVEDEDNPGVWIRDPEKKYPLLGIYNGYIGNLGQFFDEGLIGAMSIWKPNPTIDELPVPDDLQAAFDKRFLIISSDNIKSIRTNFPKLFPKRKKEK